MAKEKNTTVSGADGVLTQQELEQEQKKAPATPGDGESTKDQKKQESKTVEKPEQGSIDDFTKKEIVKMLTVKGIEFKPNNNKQNLWDLLSGENKSSNSETPKKIAVDTVFECGFAQAGASTISFVHKFNGMQHTYNLALENKRYTIPGDIADIEKQRYRRALKDNGFVDVTVIDGHAKFDEKNQKFVYKAIHAEQTQRNNITGSIGLVLTDDQGKPIFDKNGKQKTVQINIEYGIASTDKLEIYQALLKAGFLELSKERKES